MSTLDELAEEVLNKGKLDNDGPGGINIDEAKKRLEKEDQYDKQLYRERIKRKHKEQKL